MSYETGRLANETPFVVDIATSEIPLTIYLSSKAATRKIELSVDNGRQWFTPEYDAIATTDSQIVVTVLAPVSSVRFTGVFRDMWGTR